MTLINSLIAWRLKKRSHFIDLFVNNPIEVQKDCLKNLLITAKDTEWGKKFDFKSIKTTKEFSNRIPIQTYESLKKDILRTKKGESNILWPDEIKWFAKSSGTTQNKSKFIPVSVTALQDCHYKAGKDMLSIYCNQVSDTTVFTGKTLSMGGSHKIEKGERFHTGDLSAILIDNLPFWVHHRRTPQKNVVFNNDWEVKLEQMSKAVVQQNITSITGVPSWTAILFNKILKETKAQNLLEIWPNLELFMHGGVKFDPYRSQFNQLAPGLNYLETYNASEGFFGIQYDLKVQDFLLMLDYGIFYEFILANEANNENPTIFSLEEVEVGVNYAFLITTNAGLWRYNLGDTICFTSIHPFRFKFSGRTTHFINAFGEELTVGNSDKAISLTCEHFGITVKDYTAGPNFFDDSSGEHIWAIEFVKEPNNLKEFGTILDNYLKKLNSDYEAKRYGGLVLKPLRIINLKPNTFYAWHKKNNKLGGQHKIPRLLTDLKLIKELQEI